MTSEELKAWRLRHSLTQGEAAGHLGMSCRGYIKLEHGDSPIRQVVALAIEALEARLSPPAAATHTVPQIYDISLDEFRDVQQEDIDLLQRAIGRTASLLFPNRPLPPSWGKIIPGRLKVFANPMHDAGVFVAEDKALEPYDSNGHARFYPAVPKDGYCFPSQMPVVIAQELVRRWNAGAEGPSPPSEGNSDQGRAGEARSSDQSRAGQDTV